jgi:hypothetical protein
MKSKYQSVYEKMCPDDQLTDDDPRKRDIIAEMKLIAKSKTNREGAAIIEWWGWDSDQELIAFVAKARKLLSNAELTGDRKQAKPAGGRLC